MYHPEMLDDEHEELRWSPWKVLGLLMHDESGGSLYALSCVSFVLPYEMHHTVKERKSKRLYNIKYLGLPGINK